MSLCAPVTRARLGLDALLPPECLRRASSWSRMPDDVVSTMCPNWRDGSKLLISFSIDLSLMSKRGETTPHLLIRPTRFTTIFPLR